MASIIENKTVGENGYVDLDCLNLLTQQRHKLFGIEEFAESLGGNPLRGSPIWVARLVGDEEVARYVGRLNAIFSYRDANHDVTLLKSVIEDGERVYYLLIAGHRRTGALRRVRDGKTTSLSSRYPHLSIEEAFASDYPHGIEAVIFTNISADEAIALQAIENHRQPVDARDELDLLMALYKLMKEETPNMSMALFARRVGLSESTASARIRFHNLWLTAQEAVFAEVLTIEHGIVLLQIQNTWLKKVSKSAVESALAELQIVNSSSSVGAEECCKQVLVLAQNMLMRGVDACEECRIAGLSDAQNSALHDVIVKQVTVIRSFLGQAIIMATCEPKRMPVRTFKQKLWRTFEDILSGQGDLFEDFADAASRVAHNERTSVRMRHRLATLAGIQAIQGWMDRMSWLTRNGLFQREDESWKVDDVRKSLGVLLNVFEELFDLADQYLDEITVARKGKIVSESFRTLENLNS